MSKSGFGGGKSWVRIVPAGFELIFLPFSWLLRRAKAFRRSCWLFFLEEKAATRLFSLSYSQVLTVWSAQIMGLAEFASRGRDPCSRLAPHPMPPRRAAIRRPQLLHRCTNAAP